VSQANQAKLRVFLCHAALDKATVRELCTRLSSAGVDAWLDEAKLLPGQDWRLEITKALRNSDAVIVCLSHHAVAKEGFVQREVKYALDIADEKPEGAIFVLPVLFDDCEVPFRLRQFHWIRYFQTGGFDKILEALHHRAASLGRSEPKPVTPKLILRTLRSEDLQGALFSQDGSLLAGINDKGKLIIWNNENGNRRAEKEAHAGTAVALSFSADAKLLVSGGTDGTVKVWTAANLRLDRSLGELLSPVISVAISRSGKRVAASTGESKNPDLESERVSRAA
jgi:hypothetical protein